MGDLEARPWGRSGHGPDPEVVEHERRLPVVERQVFVTGAGQRFGIGPGQERLAVDGPVEGATSPGDAEVIGPVRFDAHVAADRLATGPMLFLAADDRQGIAPAT